MKRRMQKAVRDYPRIAITVMLTFLSASGYGGYTLTQEFPSGPTLAERVDLLELQSKWLDQLQNLASTADRVSLLEQKVEELKFNDMVNMNHGVQRHKEMGWPIPMEAYEMQRSDRWRR